jgi:hypothetical protein
LIISEPDPLAVRRDQSVIAFIRFGNTACLLRERFQTENVEENKKSHAEMPRDFYPQKDFLSLKECEGTSTQEQAEQTQDP